MSAREIIGYIFQFLGVLTAWPVILLVIVLLFRQELRHLLPLLAQRLKKADIIGTSFEFSEAAVKALQNSIESGAEEFKDKPDQLVNFVKEQVQKLPEASSRASTLRTALPLSGKSILWVDDNPLNNLFDENFFKQLGADVQTVTSTLDALKALDQSSYDLIISDVHRVENGHSNSNAGYELLDAIQKRKDRPALIFYTGSAYRVNPERSRSAYAIVDMPNSLRNSVLSLLRH